MKNIIYDTSIHIYGTVIKSVALFNNKAKLFVDGRKNWQSDLSDWKKQNNSDSIIWFHCASLGEFEQGKPLIEAFKKKYPESKIVLSFFSPSGYEIRKNFTGADYITYLPLDTYFNANTFIDILKPDMVFFVKYEYWYNYLTILQNKKIPTFLFSGIFRPKQIFFKWYGLFFKNILKKFSHLFVQNQSSVFLLNNIGINNVSVAGDTRFDAVWSNFQKSNQIEIVEKFKQTNKLFIVGSCWQEDFDVLLPFINDNNSSIKFIIAPHEIKTDEIKKWRNKIQKKTFLYSESKVTNSLSDHQVLIIDNIGMLSSLYQYADLVWIGGAYKKGLHNTLEAAIYGLPLFWGDKNYIKFQEANDLLEKKCAFVIKNTEDLITTLNTLGEKNLFDIQKNASEYFKQNIGGTAKIMKHIENEISKNE
ncbi:MAG: 3-deoxy-D-manno-octulosonic acid transferase [Pseudarcicella sp.]|nr:3-deoxy-D-manno-octulosonic acid transferase [Pseudarcicella sp.]MBP6411183.1 3-deoxy-D-manno-octulosonic acid transferase [Pseudarcicella sp.]